MRADDSPAEGRFVGISLAGDLQRLKAKHPAALVESCEAMQPVGMVDIVRQREARIGGLAAFSGSEQCFEDIAHRCGIGRDRLADQHSVSTPASWARYI